MQPVIDLIAHRGNAREFPENTLPALRSSLDLGLRFIEFDVHLAADHVPVVIHDHELQRTADIAGSVFDLTSAQLQTIKAGEPARFGNRYKDVPVPLLSEVVDLIAERPGATAFVEIKRASLRHHGDELVVSKILQALKPVRGSCVVISFDLAAIHLARSGGFPIGWVLTSYDEHTQLKCEALQPEYIFCNHEKLPRDGSRLWRGPWRWALYEVETPELAIALSARGAGMIETMASAPMIEALRQYASPPAE